MPCTQVAAVELTKEGYEGALPAPTDIGTAVELALHKQQGGCNAAPDALTWHAAECTHRTAICWHGLGWRCTSSRAGANVLLYGMLRNPHQYHTEWHAANTSAA